MGKISPNNPTREYLGYVDKSASDKKVVRDVFKHGDSAFISGKCNYVLHYGQADINEQIYFNLKHQIHNQRSVTAPDVFTFHNKTFTINL